MRRSKVSGKVAAITGAGSGIGRALAVELARRGASVAISDLDETGLAETASLLDGPSHTSVVDVSARDAVLSWADEVKGRFGRVNQIYNNAGIAWNRHVLDSKWADYERVLAVNLNGVIHGTHAFLPHLVASGDGAVVNVSSINGVISQPGLSQYCAAKFGVRGFTEALRTEMILTGQPVHVSVVHPGGVATAISSSATRIAEEAGEELTAGQRARERIYREKLLRMPPSKAARIIVDGVERAKPRIRVGGDAVVLDLMTRLAPGFATYLTVPLERKLFGPASGIEEAVAAGPSVNVSLPD
ncbi:SDR family NAD(P)-dependent oxidoreductase [Flexivirga oryzae]|uniref:NAD(P)-dependent dehydrogenase (Short-subunit alcohol dehydrogenase family) n=1 Tax=Flexivirga oryzae TaxID=1794944 RepID=A0A839NK39_9MICO|nr:SDR family NAD(P)-dependent oxidoreductase [Flexivirga oryzae]MBB2894204.1 NAD(P)-dependent dehydrogenase (short-subunit alcohol dehydrogenase family) [Flexivirga oryzae]MBB2894692.1 NAD(P)-dependent dehydrogenase (short-subunit alcohol dehydrogenase family) [Flexivirga oryzae]